MIKGFSKKKIKSAKTLGEVFKLARVKKHITITEAEIGTKIKSRYLSALENDKWDDLPQEVYVRGFILSYSKFLKLSVDEILTLYESELAFRQKGEETNKIAYNQSLKERKFLITPKFLAYGALTVFACVIFSYIFLQVADFAGAPSLQISSPTNNSIVEKELVDIVGVTEKDTFILINNEKVPVTNDGRFSLSFKLHRGMNVIKVNAINKAKKESSQVFTLEYKPKTASLIEVNNNN